MRKERQGQFSSDLASVGYVGQFLSPIIFDRVFVWFGVRGVFEAAALAVGGGVLALVGASFARG